MIPKFTDQVSDLSIASVYRSIPFWSWNDKLDSAELIRQIHEMKNAGMGGFFMHARGGLKTPYLSKEYLDCVSVSVREAVKLGMHAYLYDENGWPSGFADGKVCALGEEYHQKYLRFGKEVPETQSNRVIALYDENYQLLPRGSQVFAYVAWYEVNPFYVDNMDKKVVQSFIANVHNYYWNNLPEDVRENLCGIFTDEPQLSRNGIPWSFVLSEHYEKRFGNKLETIIPYLFIEMDDYRQFRINFYRLITELFRDSYFEQIKSWCDKHQWQLTGHQVLEESYDSQISSNGAVMPIFAKYSIPGNDHLGSKSSNVVSDIQLISAAAQSGKKQTITETFGCTGWNFNIRGMKWLFQQQLAHGITMLCQHLCDYSMRGLRKRDYPASIFYQHPMWHEIKPLHDSFARVGRMLTLGQDECQMVLLHGISSAWMETRGMMGEDEVVKLYLPFMQFANDLDKAGVPFHFGDEIMLEECGKVTQKSFIIGEKSYTCVVLPPLKNLARQSWNLLKEFAKNGGKIIYYKDREVFLQYIDGKKLTIAEQQFVDSLETVDCFEEFLNKITYLGINQINCTTADKAFGRVRGCWRHFPEDRQRWYFLTDFGTSKENSGICPFYHDEYNLHLPETVTPIALEVTLPYQARQIKLIDQATGAVAQIINHINTPNGAKFVYSLPASESILLCAENMPDETVKMDLSDNWCASVTQNVLTIDQARCQVENHEFSTKKLNTLTIFNRLLSLEKDVNIVLDYEFDIAEKFNISKGNLQMALELADDCEYYLNNTLLTIETCGFFLDRSIKCIVLPHKLIRHGKNIFRIKQRFTQSKSIRQALRNGRIFEGEANKIYFDSEVESIYLLGNFSVVFQDIKNNTERGCRILNGECVIMPVSEKVYAGELVRNGYPFFSGEMTLSREFKLSDCMAKKYTTLNLGYFLANSVKITLNDKELKTIFAEPYTVDVAGVLKSGINTITLKITTSCRNTLGPLHTATVNPAGVAPESFLLENDILNRIPLPYMHDYGVLEFGCEKVILY